MRRVFLSSISISAFLLSCCGRIPGGIVDNGTRPRKPTETPNQNPTPDPNNPDGQTSTVAISLRVLNDYTVSVPSDEWTAVTEGNTTTLKQGLQVILFSLTDLTCDSPTEKNAFGVEIHWCGPEFTLLDIDEGPSILADHSTLTTDIEAIIRSFRREPIAL